MVATGNGWQRTAPERAWADPCWEYSPTSPIKASPQRRAHQFVSVWSQSATDERSRAVETDGFLDSNREMRYR